MSWDLGMNYWYQLVAQTIGTCQMQLPGACSQHGWTTTKEPIGRRDHATDPGRPEGQKPGLTGSTTRSAQVRGAEVVDRQPTLDR